MKKRVIAALVALTLALCCVLSGCGEEKKQNENEEYLEENESASLAGLRRTVLYYQSAQGHVVPVMRMIPWEEGIGRAALSYLVATEDNAEALAHMGLTAPVPEGTSFSLRIGDDREATVDIRGCGEIDGASAERAMVTAVVNTLTEFPTIDTVKITVEGKELDKLPNGTNVKHAFTTLALNAEETELAVSALNVNSMTLYFPNQTGSLNIPVTRYTERDITLEGCINALIDGPADASMLGCFPDGTRLNSASVVDGVAKVDLTEAFFDARYTEGLAEAAYETMFLTASALEDIYALELTIEGEPYEPGADVTAPVYANEYIARD